MTQEQVQLLKNAVANIRAAQMLEESNAATYRLLDDLMREIEEVIDDAEAQA